MPLSALDWIVIVAYVLVVLGVGLAYARRAGSSMTEFFASGRSLPWWIAGTSMVATTFAADTPLAVTGLVAQHGLAGNWFWWAFALGGMFTVFVYARLWRRAEVLTDVELVELRYSGPAAAFLRGLRAVYVALIVNSIIIGWVTGAMITVLRCTVLAPEAGAAADGAADWLLILVLLGIVGVYSTMAGMWGVAITDVVQFVLAMAGCIALAVIAVDHVGGVDELRGRVAASFGAGGEAQAFSFLPDFAASDPWMPVQVFLLMLFVQWWATWYPGAEPGGGGYVVQRMAACKDERHSLLATLWFQVAHYCVRPWPWLVVAFVALAMHPELRQWATDGDTATDPGRGFPMVMAELAPAGLRGLLLVAFFSAFMSTISTQMNWGASYLVNDVYYRFVRPDADDKTLARASRVASVVVLAVGALTAGMMTGISVDAAWKMLAALGAGTGAVFMLRWFWWRINAWSEITAMVASLVLFVLLRGVIANDTYLMAAVAAITIVVWVTATLVTAPEKPETLAAFFRKVRPGGPGWGPQRRAHQDVAVDDRLGLSIVAALFGAGIVLCTIPGVGALIFAEHGRAAACLGGAAGCAAVVAVLVRRITAGR